MPVSLNTFPRSSTRPIVKARSTSEVEQTRHLKSNGQLRCHPLWDTTPYILVDGQSQLSCTTFSETSQTCYSPRLPHHESHTSLPQEELDTAKGLEISPVKCVDTYCLPFGKSGRCSFLEAHSRNTMPDIPLSINWSGSHPVNGPIITERCLVGNGGDYCTGCEGGKNGDFQNLCACLEFPTLGTSDNHLAIGNTPFAEYVDRSVPAELYGHSNKSSRTDDNIHDYSSMPEGDMNTVQEVDPAYIKDYRKMAEPLSEWVATYVWSTCLNGGASRFTGSGNIHGYGQPVPPILARSTYTLLCSTLLQPSAIILSLWYITQLPVQIGGDIIRGLSALECEFRNELFDQSFSEIMGEEYANLEISVPFRLILLGCMLANKWLDDHTFSNKTWQNITSIPICSINRLELFALNVLGHNLSVNPTEWREWLRYLHQYHLSRFPYPAPIQRPSTSNPIAYVRKVLEDLTSIYGPGEEQPQTLSPPVPVFCPMSVVTGKKANTHVATNTLEFDLDEDGPLREEYAVKHSSRAASKLNFRCTGTNENEMFKANMMRVPPPAEWSPGYDPPLFRSIHGHQGYPSAKPYEGVSKRVVDPALWNGTYDVAHAQYFGKPTTLDHIGQPSSVNKSLDPVCLPKNNETVPTLILPYPSSQHRLYSQAFASGFEPCYPSVGDLRGGYSYGDNFLNLGHFRPLWLYT